VSVRKDTQTSCCNEIQAALRLLKTEEQRMRLIRSNRPYRLGILSDCKHTDTVRTSQQTHYVCATEPNRLMLFTVRTIRNTQIQSVPHRKHTEHTDTVRTSQETYGTHRYSPYLTGTIRNTQMHFMGGMNSFNTLQHVCIVTIEM
jgi:hypothetical protein